MILSYRFRSLNVFKVLYVLSFCEEIVGTAPLDLLLKEELVEEVVTDQFGSKC